MNKIAQIHLDSEIALFKQWIHAQLSIKKKFTISPFIGVGLSVQPVII